MDSTFWTNDVPHFRRSLVVASSRAEQNQLCSDFVVDIGARYGEPYVSLAYELVQFHKARCDPDASFQVGTIMVDDHSTHVGQNMVGSASGERTRVEIKNSEVYKNVVNTSQHIPDDLKPLLVSAREALDTAPLEQEVKAAVLESFEKLTDELQKPEPNKGVIQYVWNGLSQVATTVVPMIELGKKLADMFGIENLLG